EKWAYPCVNNPATGQCEYKSAQLVIEFGILRDGRVPFVIVRKESDFDIYDEYAVNAIKLASPFPPMPDSVADGRKGRAILATFSYIAGASLIQTGRGRDELLVGGLRPYVDLHTGCYGWFRGCSGGSVAGQ